MCFRKEKTGDGVESSLGDVNSRRESNEEIVVASCWEITRAWIKNMAVAMESLAHTS